jgi:hypothetical protein
MNARKILVAIAKKVQYLQPYCDEQRQATLSISCGFMHGKKYLHHRRE